MAASDIPLVAVCGSTGAQGGGVVRGLLAAGNVRIRALTRNVESPKAVALAEQGCEVVQADFNDQGSLEQAFAGVNRVFVLTNSFAKDVMSGDKEIVLIQNIGNALAAVGGIEYCVHSIFEDTRKFIGDTRPTVQENYKVPHFDAKNEGNAYLRSVGLNVYTLNTGYYMENIINPMYGVTKDDAGVISFVNPCSAEDKPFCLLSVGDIGLAAARLLADPELGTAVTAANGENGQDFGMRPQWLTNADIAAVLANALGVEIRGAGVDYAEFAANMPWMGDELANMFYFYCEHREQMLPDMSAQLLEEPVTLEAFVGANLDAIRAGWAAKDLL